MKKIFLSSIICFLSISISSCSNTSTSNSLSSLSEEKFLIEGVDYVDHSSAYNGKKFIYNDSMWYINELVNVSCSMTSIFDGSSKTISSISHQ